MKNLMFKYIILLIILNLNLNFNLNSTVYAQSFTASVQNTTVSEGEPFEVSFTFQGSDINSLSNFTAPSFGGLKIISGPNQSTSMQIINGNVSASRTTSFIVVAPSVGKYTIGSASIEYKGQKLKTEPIQITSIKGSPKPKEERKGTEVNTNEIAENLFIRAVVDKNRAYVGEQVTVTYKLYTRLNIAAQMSISKLPQYVGFWAEEIETARTLSFTTEVVDGKKFNVAVLKKAALFPTQSGKLEITPFELTVPIAIRRNRNINDFWDSFFDDPFNRQQVYDYQAKSNIVKIDVLPLPEQDKPIEFNGTVGKFNITASIDKNEVKVNEPITLSIRISGTGNIALLQPPVIEFPAGFEKYDPKITEDINRASKISGTKDFEYLLIPRAAGTRELKPIELIYFDPELKKYQISKTLGFTIKITPNDSLLSLYNIEKENIKDLDSDIRSIKTNYDDITRDKNFLIYSSKFLFATFIPLLAFAGILYWNNYNRRIASDIKAYNYLRAEKVAKRKLKKSLAYLTNNRPKEFYTEIAQAFYGYLENKLDISKSDFTLDLTYDKLIQLGVDSEIAAKMKNTGERCEFVRFAPGAEQNTSMKGFYDEVLNTIIEIEKSLNR